jgi:uncharacterized protein YkwD
MVGVVRIAVLVGALTAGSSWTLQQLAPSATATAASAESLVARPGDAASRLRNQRQVVTPPAPPPTVPVDDVAAQVIALTNAERARAGVGAVVAHPDLMVAALGHSRDQAAMGRMTHTGSDGSNAGVRITRAGYTWRTWAENVAYGYPDATSVVGGWMGSSGHRANILSGSFVHIGVAAVADGNGRLYWTMVLAA